MKWQIVEICMRGEGPVIQTLREAGGLDSVWSKNKWGVGPGPPGPSPGSSPAQHLLELWQRFAPFCTPLPART